jgi:hypothetical protein
VGVEVGPDATGGGCVGGCVGGSGGVATGGLLVGPLGGGGFGVGGCGCLGVGFRVGRGAEVGVGAAETNATRRCCATRECACTVAAWRRAVACGRTVCGAIVTVGVGAEGPDACSLAAGDRPTGSSAARQR